MGVQFDEENIPQHHQRALVPKGLIGLLINHGIAKDEAQANTILLGVLIVALFGIAYFVFFGPDSKDLPPPLPEPVASIQEMRSV